MDEDEHLHRFGTPLDPLVKDEVPAKKPVAIEDQIVKDENGKRRFHGAFTGGFSAGFWNTVGSLEGWTPQNFKSSRGEKATKVQQRPEDFMDKEDLGEFGIAPQGIRTRDEFSKESEEQRSSQRKRKLMQPDVAGPIPGVPVLEQLLRPVRDKVAVRILKSMGWKPGQGVGPRQTRKEKRQASARNKREQYLLEHYGAEGLSANVGHPAPSDDDDNEEENENEEDEEEEEEITFAPDDYEPVFYAPKDNRFGMSYTGLSRAPVLSKSTTPAAPMQHINLFGPAEPAAKQQKLSIRGQAFGVGAFEEEDEDIYARDDLTRYDFSLADKQPKQKKAQHVQQRHVIEGFGEDKASAACTASFAIDLPRDFQPRNWQQRRSRFAPMEAARAQKLAAASEHKRAGLGRHDLNPDQRAKLLGEQVPEEQPKQPKQPEQLQQPQKKNPFKAASSARAQSLLERISAKSNNFASGGVITATGEEQPVAVAVAAVAVTAEVQQANAALLEKATAKTKNFASTAPSGGFKPFLGNEAKQARYDQFLAADLKDDAEMSKFLSRLQPVTLSLWDREMERKEFVQAAKIYKPLAGLMLDRFVSEAAPTSAPAEVEVEVSAEPAEPRKIVVERTKLMWKPCAALCKRYNIAEPFGGALPDPEKELKRKPKMSIFDYLETSVNTKANFQTPTIRPQHIEAPKIVQPLETIQPPEAVQSLETAAPAAPLKPTEEVAATSTAASDNAPAPAATVTAKPSFVPRTPLEQAVDESRNKPISEKIDLFKSIFADSDEEEPAPAAAAPMSADEKLANMQAALGLPSTMGAASAAAANVLRNNSPPRGIFAALFKPPEEQPEPAAKIEAAPKFAPIPGNKLKIAYKSREERLRNDKELALAAVPAEQLYGPKLPTKSPGPGAGPGQEPEVAAEASIDARLQQLWQQHAPKKPKVEDQWVERRRFSSDDSDADSSSGSDSSESSDSSSDKHRKAKVKRSHKSSAKKSKKHKEKEKTKSKSKSKKKAKKLDKSSKKKKKSKR